MKIVDMPKKEDEIYITEDLATVLKDLQEWIKVNGCFEIFVVVMGMEGTDEEFSTPDRTLDMLGRIDHYHRMYANDYEEFEYE